MARAARKNTAPGRNCVSLATFHRPGLPTATRTSEAEANVLCDDLYIAILCTLPNQDETICDDGKIKWTRSENAERLYLSGNARSQRSAVSRVSRISMKFLPYNGLRYSCIEMITLAAFSSAAKLRLGGGMNQSLQDSLRVHAADRLCFERACGVR